MVLKETWRLILTHRIEQENSGKRLRLILEGKESRLEVRNPVTWDQSHQA